MPWQSFRQSNLTIPGSLSAISPWIEVNQKRLFMLAKRLKEPLDAVSTLVNG